MSEGSFQVQPGAAAGAATLEVSEFESLLKKEFKPKSDQARAGGAERRPDAGGPGLAGHHADFRRCDQDD